MRAAVDRVIAPEPLERLRPHGLRGDDVFALALPRPAASRSRRVIAARILLDLYVCDGRTGAVIAVPGRSR